MRVLSDKDVASVLDLEELLSVVESAFRKQGRDEVERPERPHFDVGIGVDGEAANGTALTMPAYIHGATYYATKLVDVHDSNRDAGLPTVNAQLVLTDAATGVPAAFMDGTRITSARTGCIGGLAADALAEEPIRLGIIGAGTQARWQARAIAAATTVERVWVYSPSDSRRSCAADLRERGLDAIAVDSPRLAVEDANVVVTATTSAEPVFPGSALRAGTVVVAVGAYDASMRELDSQTVMRAETVFADVPEEAAGIGDMLGVDAERIEPLSDVLAGGSGRDSPKDILVVESVGSAALDAAVAEHLFERAKEERVGREVEL